MLGAGAECRRLPDGNRPRLGRLAHGATCLLVAVDNSRPKVGRAQRVRRSDQGELLLHRDQGVSWRPVPESSLWRVGPFCLYRFSLLSFWPAPSMAPSTPRRALPLIASRTVKAISAGKVQAHFGRPVHSFSTLHVLPSSPQAPSPPPSDALPHPVSSPIASPSALVASTNHHSTAGQAAHVPPSPRA